MISFSLKHAQSIFILCVLSLFSSACAGIEKESSREVGFADPGKKVEAKRTQITALELQEDLQRFTSTFMARAYLAFQPPKEKVSPGIFHILQNDGLLYVSSALDIATGPNPESNLLDMLAFMTLTRQSIEEYWIPQVYGAAAGREPLLMFKKSEAEIWEIAAKVSSAEQRGVYRGIIQDWKKENPGIQRTETVRLAEVYLISGQAGSERSKEVSGLLGQIKSAVVSTDQIVLLSQRALFLANRVPFLLRLQARIGAREIVSDTIEEFARSDELIKGMQGIHPLIKDLTVLSSSSEEAFKRLEGAVKEATLEKLRVMEQIVTKANLTMEGLLNLNPESATPLIIETRIQLERLIYIFLASILVIILAWWVGYVWAKKKLMRAQQGSEHTT